MYEPELTVAEQKLKEIIRAPFLKIQGFDKIFSDGSKQKNTQVLKLFYFNVSKKRWTFQN